MEGAEEIAIGRVGITELGELLPLLRAYCDFYEVAPRDERLVALCRTLIDDPGEGAQLLARDADGRPIGFATVFWTWQTLDAARIGILNDLYVVPAERGRGVGRRLLEACRGLARKRGIGKLAWETAPGNETAQRLYDSLGARRETWITYEIETWD